MEIRGKASLVVFPRISTNYQANQFGTVREAPRLYFGRFRGRPSFQPLRKDSLVVFPQATTRSPKRPSFSCFHEFQRLTTLLQASPTPPPGLRQAASRPPPGFPQASCRPPAGLPRPPPGLLQRPGFLQASPRPPPGRLEASPSSPRPPPGRLQLTRPPPGLLQAASSYPSSRPPPGERDSGEIVLFALPCSTVFLASGF
jgi:hypothetical protein